MQGWERQVAETAQRFRALQERLSSLSITETSGDGAVKVTVSAAGLLTDLVLRERWHSEPLPALAAEIMDCVRRAQARIPDLLRQAMFETVGSQDPSTHLLLAEAGKRFPEPAPAEPRQARRPAPDSGGDWDEREFLEQL
jgi:DNA-binding protein YbaB